LTREIAEANRDEIQELAVGLPRLRKKTGMKYLPMLTAGKNELILFEEGNPILKYKSSKSDMTLSKLDLIAGKKSRDSELDAIDNFIENMAGEPHLVGFFGDDIDVARSIELHYLAVGLYGGETCIYVFPEDQEYGTADDIRNQMIAYLKSKYTETDARLEHLMRNFHVYNPQSAIGDPEGEVKAVWRIFENALKLGKPPYRLVIHVYKKIASREDLEAHMVLEKAVDDGFEAVKGSALCNHYRRAIDLEPELFQTWLNSMLKCHDYAFYTMNKN
jgi:hypothetical protein